MIAYYKLQSLMNNDEITKILNNLKTSVNEE